MTALMETTNPVLQRTAASATSGSDTADTVTLRLILLIDDLHIRVINRVTDGR